MRTRCCVCSLLPVHKLLSDLPTSGSVKAVASIQFVRQLSVHVVCSVNAVASNPILMEASRSGCAVGSDCGENAWWELCLRKCCVGAWRRRPASGVRPTKRPVSLGLSSAATDAAGGALAGEAAAAAAAGGLRGRGLL